jgi:maleamate amidohydrolase
MTDAFKAASYGEREIGYGERPAVLVVDFQKGFCDPRFQTGRSPRVHAARDRTVELVKAARRCNVPVVACTAGWFSEKDMQPWKVSALYRDFFDGEEAAEVDPAIKGAGYDFLFKKCAPSIFFQTPIIPFLTKHNHRYDHRDGMRDVGMHSRQRHRQLQLWVSHHGRRRLLRRSGARLA